MDADLRQFIRSRRSTSNNYTHVSLIEPKGRYSISRHDFGKLWDLYCDKVQKSFNEEEKDENAAFISGLAEKPQKYIPVMSDVDIKVKFNGQKLDRHIYSNKQLKSIVSIYQKVLKEVIYNCTDKHLQCLVLEKPPYMKSKDVVSSGFHLHFPFTFMDKVAQEIHVNSRVKKYVEQERVFDDLNLIGAPIDDAPCRNTWMMYGARKSVAQDTYVVTQSFNHDMESVPLHQALDEYKIYDESEQEIKIEKDIEYYLPQILSIFPFGRKTSNIRQDLSFLQREVMTMVRDLPDADRDTPVSELLQDAQSIIRLMSDKRADDHSDWLKIGFVLHNIGEGCSEALDIWIEFSQRSEKFEEEVCYYTWDRMKSYKYSMGTLKYYASIDNPLGYGKWRDFKGIKKAKQNLDGCHYDIAKVMYIDSGNHHVYAGGKEKLWFKFNNGIWHKDYKGIALRSTISRSVASKYQKIAIDLVKTLGDCPAGEDKAVQAKIKQANKIVSNLKSSTFKNNIMKEAEEVFYVENFTERLDTNKYLIAFTNGVYDLRRHALRPGIPEDYLSACIPHDYKEYTSYSEEVTNIESFLEKVFPDKSLRTYFMDSTSDLFVGGNPRKIIDVWSGDGDNGKSITDKLIEISLGKRYSVKVPTSLICGKRTQSSQACPELARAGNGVRRLVAQEPNKGDRANVGLLKELSGNDSFFVRGLYSDGNDIDPLFMLTIVCNDMPRLDSDDPALWNRLRVLLFESNFVDNPPETYEEQLRTKTFPKDPEFGDKLPSMCMPFLWLLLNHRKERMLSGRVRRDPKKVCSATAMYRRSNDTYRQFIEECLVKDDKTVMSLIEIYNCFKTWFKDSFPGRNLPAKIDIEDYLTKRWGKMKPGYKFKGYRPRTLKDDLESGDAIELGDDDLAPVEDLEEELKEEETIVAPNCMVFIREGVWRCTKCDATCDVKQTMEHPNRCPILKERVPDKPLVEENPVIVKSVKSKGPKRTLKSKKKIWDEEDWEECN